MQIQNLEVLRLHRQQADLVDCILPPEVHRQPLFGCGIVRHGAPIPPAPVAGITTLTATATGTIPAKLFIRVVATN